MSSVQDIFVTVCAVLMMVLCDVPHPSTAQDLVFSTTSDVDGILQSNFGLTGGGISTRISPSAGTCATSDSSQGQCILLSQCPIYLPLIKNIRDPQVSRFLRDRICRLEVNSVRICCPSNPQNAGLPTSSTTSKPQNSRPSSGGFVQPQPPSQSRPTQPVRISFGGAPNNSPPNLPVLPTQNRPSTSLPPQNRPVLTTTTVPRTSSQSAGGSFFPSTQNRFTPAAENPTTQFSVSLPVVPPQLLPVQPILPPQQPSQVDPTREPQIGVSFAPSALQPDRMNFEQSEGTSPMASPILQVPTNIIPSERECGSPDAIKNLRTNGLSNSPWLVAVGYLQGGGKFEVMCGGAIITRRHVITAAHCLSLNRLVTEIPTHIRLGDYDLDRSNDMASPQDIRIESYRTPGHETDTFIKDIAVITLSQDIRFNEFLQPVCLPNRFLYDGFRYQSLDVIGWRHTLLIKGRNELPQTPTVFRAPVIGLSDCRRRYKPTSKSVVIDRNNLCAASSSDGTCLRDSGSLAVFHDEATTHRYFLVGLGSFGFGCDRPEEPFVYTRVGAFLEWVEEVISNETSASSA